MRAGVEFVVAATNELSVRCKVIQRNTVKCQSRCWVGHKTAGVCASFVHLIFYWESQIRNYKWPLISEFVYQCDTKQQITLCLPTFVFMPKSRIKNWKKKTTGSNLTLIFNVYNFCHQEIIDYDQIFHGPCCSDAFFIFSFLKSSQFLQSFFAAFMIMMDWIKWKLNRTVK